VSALTQLTGARRALVVAQTVPELRQVRDLAAAMQKYIRGQRLGLHQQNEAAEVKIRCERRLGELLAETVRHEGGRPRKNGNGPLPFPGLPEGVTKIQSSRWQQVFRIPDDIFENWIAMTRAAGEELTTTALLAAAPKAIFNAEQELELAEGGCDDDGIDPPRQDEVEPKSYIQLVHLFLTVNQHPDFLGYVRCLQTEFGTDSITDTVFACVAWASARLTSSELQRG
jgi:hypothetical protein